MNNNFIDWLIYRSYEWNRIKSPHVPYYKWRKIYKDAVIFEEIYDNYIKQGAK